MHAYLDAFRAEPAVANPPRRVWRDWALVWFAVCAAVLETLLRTDLDWRWASLVTCLAAVPALLFRRRHPLAANVVAYGLANGLSVVAALAGVGPEGLGTTAFALICTYALYRWGSGRDGLIGVVLLLVALVVGNLTDGGAVSEWIGGAVVLTVPVQLGLFVRYRGSARARQLEDVKVREREQLARELHDTVAHHVSAIAVQAQAGRAGAAASPQAALDALAVIEREASRTLAEMRAMVGALRYTGADLAPQRGVADLHELALRVPQRLDVEIDDHLGALSPAVDSAIYRIAQEAVTNAGRHARGATRITVRVASSPTHVTLTVADDGAGGAYDPTMSRGFGLLGMAERAHLLGGSFSAGPSTPRGWAVAAELPRSGVGP